MTRRETGRYLSVCSGICAPTVAWKRLGMTPVGFAEIEKFPSAVLAHHYPDTPNLGDITAEDFIDRAAALKPDGLVGGTPCQPFSVAGKGDSLEDERGQLTLRYMEILHGCGASWAVWENVPGVLGKEDNPFGCFLACVIGAKEALVPSDGERKWDRAGAAYGPKAAAAWRVLDAQYFGLAQRRKRVFVVIRVGATGFDPAKVLFECEGVRRDTPPSRKAGSHVAALTANGVGTCGADDNQAQAGHIVMAHGQASAEIVSDGEPSLTCNHEAPIVFDTTQVTSPHNQSNPNPGDPSHTLSAGSHPPAVCVTGERTHALTAEGHDASEDGTGRGTPVVAYQCHGGNVGPMGTLRTGGDVQSGVPVFAIQERAVATGESGPGGKGWQEGLAYTMEARHRPQNAVAGTSVRRLIPRECERLQGFPDDFTLVPFTHGKPAADGPRYKAIGNSMAKDVLHWLGVRLLMFGVVTASAPLGGRDEDTT